MFKLILLAVLFLFVATDKSKAQAPVQTVRGRVIDMATQAPLPGASVILTSQTPAIGSISDKDGYFRIKNVPVGRHEIQVSYIGYNSKKVADVLVISGKETYLTLQLKEEIVKSEELIVKGMKDVSNPNNDLAVASVTSLRPEMINRFAGSRQDPARMAANTAGVAGDDNQRNDIIVRGNSPLGVLWRLEGVDIPNPNHFTVAGTGGGVFAVINNNLLANCDFLTGAFPAEYGNKTAAVFDVQLRNGNNEENEYTFQIGLNGVEVGAEGPISKENKSSYLASVRFVSLEPLKKLGLDLSAETVPQYLDGTFKIYTPAGDAGIFSFWGMGGHSRASVLHSQDGVDWTVTQRVEDENLESNLYALGMSHTCFFGKNTFGRLNVSTSASNIITHNEFVFSDKSIMPAERYHGFEGQHLINYSVTAKLSSAHLLKIGAAYRNMFFNNSFRDWDDDNKVYEQRMLEHGEASLVQAFAHLQYRITEDFEIHPGIYYQLFTLNNSQAIEPRFAAKYKLGETQDLGFAYGMHSQTHPLLYYFFRFEHNNDNKFVATNKNMDFTRSHEFVLSYKNQLWSDFLIKAEVYYQYLYDVPVSKYPQAAFYSYMNLGAEFSFNPFDSTVNEGTGKNFGIELTLEKYFSDGWYGLVTLSLFDSKFKTTDNKWRNTAFNLGHVLNILGGKEFRLDDNNKNVLSFDFKVAHIGGRRIRPVNVEKSIEMGYAVRDLDRAFEESLKDHFQIDVKISYNLNLESTTHSFFIAVDNMLNTQNPWKQNWNNDTKKITYDYQLGLLPYLGYRINF